MEINSCILIIGFYVYPFWGRMSLDEWMAMLTELDFFDEDFNRREGVFCHAWSIMQIVDDFENQNRVRENRLF